MSVQASAQLHCPACDHAWAGSLPVSVNPERHRDAPQQVRDRSLWTRPCPACGQAVSFDVGFSWTDFAHLHFVMVRPVAEGLTGLPALEQEARRLLHQTVAGHPRAIEDRSLEFRIRVVAGAERLREKLLLWEAGLDDALVELLKLTTLRDRPDLRRPSTELVIVGVDELLHTEVWRHSRPVERLALERARLSELRAVRGLLLDDFSPLFTGSWVDARRLPLWAALCGSAASPEETPSPGPQNL